LSEGTDARVFAVEHHGFSGCGGYGGEHPAGGVDFAEAVKLIAQHVQQQRIVGFDGFDEVHGVRLV
jgi:hypothetical protein